MNMKMIGYSLIMVVTSMMLFSACTINSQQAKVLANQAGLYSAVGWIAVDNPPVEVKSNMVNILTVIVSRSASISTNQSYSDLYPDIVKLLNTQPIPQQYKPLTLVGTVTVLGGIDMLFATYPNLKSKQDVALMVVTSFCDGAKNGLNMTASDPIMKSAVKTSILRHRAFISN